jgi:hypothetical protein
VIISACIKDFFFLIQNLDQNDFKKVLKFPGQ